MYLLNKIDAKNPPPPFCVPRMNTEEEDKAMDDTVYVWEVVGNMVAQAREGEEEEEGRREAANGTAPTKSSTTPLIMMLPLPATCMLLRNTWPERKGSGRKWEANEHEHREPQVEKKRGPVTRRHTHRENTHTE